MCCANPKQPFCKHLKEATNVSNLTGPFVLLLVGDFNFYEVIENISWGRLNSAKGQLTSSSVRMMCSIRAVFKVISFAWREHHAPPLFSSLIISSKRLRSDLKILGMLLRVQGNQYWAVLSLCNLYEKGKNVNMYILTKHKFRDSN